MDLEHELKNNLLIKKPSTIMENFEKTSLFTNHFSLTLESFNQIQLYSLKITPEIKEDNRLLLLIIINLLKKQISEKIGTFFHTGRTIFALKSKDPFNLTTKYSNIEYSISINFLKSIKLEDLKNEFKNNEPAKQFLSSLVKQALKALNMREIGKNAQYFNQLDVKEVKGLPISVMQGII